MAEELTIADFFAITAGPLSQDEFRIYFVSRLAQDGFYEETVPKILSQAEGRVTIDSSSVIRQVFLLTIHHSLPIQPVLRLTVA